MKYNLILILIYIFVNSCAPYLKTLNHENPYTSKGFAYVYNADDFNTKIISAKMNNNNLQLSHMHLKTGTLIKITNPKNMETLVLKNVKRIRYPDFYKILITEAVAEKLDLNKELPLLEITEIKKNKSFIAKKAKIYVEEKQIPSKAPVASVKISNISKSKTKKIKKNTDEIFIQIASFYTEKTARFLKKRIIEELKELPVNKLKIQKQNNKETHVILGPYNSINLLKNDYIKLKDFGFEELDIFIND